jgi:Flp pilus assembly protein TadB
VDPNAGTPVSITSARRARSADIHRRQTRYLLSMGLRTVCFVLAIVFTGPARWVFVVAAVVLPYIAVVLANAADSRSAAMPATFYDDKPQITGEPDTTADGSPNRRP